MGKFITPKRLETFWATAVNKLTEGINGKKLSSNDLTDELKEKYDKAESNKIDSISVNGEKQTIDTDKNVNIEFDAGTGIQDITQEEYDALSEEEKMRDTIYHITDTEDDNVIVNVMLGETGKTAYAGDKGKALADKIGDTDISAIGDGTCSGAINAVNENKLDKTETAASASKLSNTSAIGSATKPVYFNANGVPVAGTYELNKSVPSDAKFTDTTYSNATTSVAGLMSATDKSKINMFHKPILDVYPPVPSFTFSLGNGTYLLTMNKLDANFTYYWFGILCIYDKDTYLKKISSNVMDNVSISGNRISVDILVDKAYVIKLQ